MTAEKRSGFSTPLVVESIDHRTWCLEDDLIWTGTKGDMIVVPAGEETDFASVPRVLQSVMPATGAWTKAAVVHDMLCRELNDWHRKKVTDPWSVSADRAGPPPTFSSNDTDAVFELIMAMEGTGPIMRRIGWVGVRWGALWNPARRSGWLQTSPRLLALSAALLAALVGLLALLGWVLPW